MILICFTQQAVNVNAEDELYELFMFILELKTLKIQRKPANICGALDRFDNHPNIYTKQE